MASFLNYTTSVPVDRTLLQIQKMLVSHGAQSIIINYEDLVPASMSFMIDTENGRMPFQLPANISAVARIMEEKHLPGYKKPGQPARVAWRVIKDWVEAQLAIIEAGMAPVEQVFLPYLLTDGKRTLFEVMSEKGFLIGDGGK